MVVAFEDQCGRPVIASNSEIGDPGKQRYCELQRGHDGDHCTTYCGKDFRWRDAMSENIVGLLPCPFCGDTSEMLNKKKKRGLYLYQSAPSSDMPTWQHVCCLNCGAGHSSVEKWNTRCVDGNVVVEKPSQRL